MSTGWPRDTCDKGILKDSFSQLAKDSGTAPSSKGSVIIHWWIGLYSVAKGFEASSKDDADKG